jgi:hypothetical protein
MLIDNMKNNQISRYVQSNVISYNALYHWMKKLNYLQLGLCTIIGHKSFATISLFAHMTFNNQPQDRLVNIC